LRLGADFGDVHAGVAGAHDVRHRHRQRAARQFLDDRHAGGNVHAGAAVFFRHRQAAHAKLGQPVEHGAREQVLAVPAGGRLARHFLVHEAAQLVAQQADVFRFGQFEHGGCLLFECRSCRSG